MRIFFGLLIVLFGTARCAGPGSTGCLDDPGVCDSEHICDVVSNQCVSRTRDMAMGRRDLAVPADLAAPTDLAAPKDLAMSDLAMTRDLAAPPDMNARDLAAPRDLAERDMTAPMDLAMPDLAMPDLAMPDLAMPTDLAIPPDLAAPPDMLPPGPRGVCSADDWCWRNPLPHGNSIQDIWGSDASHVWAVGTAGQIVMWDGSAWVPQASGTTKNLGKVWGLDATHVWAAGDDGTIL